MIKKLIVTSVVLLGAATFLFGKNAASYLKTCGSEFRAAVKEQVPLDFEIRRANQLVEDLVPEIRKAMHIIAEQQVDIESLKQSIASREKQLASQKEAILTLREDLDQQNTTYVYHGRQFTPSQVERDLSGRFNRYQLSQQTHEREQQILAARENALMANEEHLANLLAAKKDMEVQLAQLDARMRAVQTAEEVSQLNLDDTPLNRAKALITEVNKQLDIKERLLDTEGTMAGTIPVEKDLEPQVHLSQQIDEYFADELANRPL